MGRVYLGRSRSGRAVAVKVIRPDLADDQDFRRRFGREIALARTVSGFFTAAVVDADPDGSPPWMATAYVPGMSLGDAVREYGPWPEASVLALGVGLAEALESIHAAGVVHRDLKPSNVLLAADGPRLIDFGISVATEASRLTQTGMAVGTPGFISPEQLTGAPVGAASDVFCLAAVLVFTATGTGPFGTGSWQGLWYRTVNQEPDLTALSPRLRAVVAPCLAKQPEQRPTVAALLEELTPSVADGRTVAEIFTQTTWLPEPVAEIARTQIAPPWMTPTPIAPTPAGILPTPSTPAGTSRRRALIALATIGTAIAGLTGWQFLGNGRQPWFFITGDRVDSSTAVADRQLWSFTTGDPVTSSPTVANGVVYVGSDDNKLYALDAVTGQQRWSFTTGGEIGSSPTVAEGAVYVGDDRSMKLYAVDTATGRKRWSFTTDGRVRSSPAIADGVVYFGSYDNELYALDAVTGRKRWSFNTGDYVYSSPVVANGVVYFGSNDNKLYAVDTATGRKHWSFNTGGGVNSSPAIADGMVYVGSDDNKLYALDADHGQQRWSFTTGGEVISSPAIADGVVYFGSYDKKLYALDAATGRKRWSFNTGDYVNSSPVVANGVVYFGSNDSKLYAVDTVTGRQRWSFTTGDGVVSSPAVANGAVYVGSIDKKLYARRM
ncbi:serine/threonine protein kinase [Nonomuraea terrae]|uniref:Serine/threonine protein kinase n=2 Tax=Nonomuraea terrae TaxID=2530383 RepID=A0A4R4YXQ6_9ACTN|nr:serine/threonine protein kinase [Nonomuraea terrae]